MLTYPRASHKQSHLKHNFWYVHIARLQIFAPKNIIIIQASIMHRTAGELRRDGKKLKMKKKIAVE